MISIEIASHGIDQLGESPQWHARERRLYWVDSFAPAICRMVPFSETGATGATGPAGPAGSAGKGTAHAAVERFALPADIGSFVFARDGSLIAGMRSGFNRIRLGDDGAASATVISNPVGRDPRLMLNDGKCDRHGRYWCASVHSDFIGRQAELFRLDPDFVSHRIDGGFIIGNGISFSPDDRRMYLADSRDETVWVYDFDLASGSVSNRRRFFSTAGIDGRVDGATCDRDGNYWCALIHGGAIACISPEGRMIERIAVPARHPTMVAFGGRDLAVLFVTSASILLAPDERQRWPDAGKLFRINGLGARGLPEPEFG